MLNSVGLQNVGIEAFIREKLPRLRSFRTHIVANFFGDTPEEYAAVAARASEADGIAALEANISCPNVQHGGMLFSSDPQLTFQVVSAVRRATSLPLIVKLSPNVTDIVVIARAAEEAGADAVSLINTFMSMAIDLETRTPRLPLGFGGLSGPAIKPIALRMVWQVAQGVRIPVIGLGGISTGEDAWNSLLPGPRPARWGRPALSIQRRVETFCDSCSVTYNVIALPRWQNSVVVCVFAARKRSKPCLPWGRTEEHGVWMPMPTHSARKLSPVVNVFTNGV